MTFMAFFVGEFYDDEFIASRILGILLVVRQHRQLQTIALAGAMYNAL